MIQRGLRNIYLRYFTDNTQLIFLQLHRGHRGPPLAISSRHRLAMRLAITRTALSLFQFSPRAASLRLVITPTTRLSTITNPLHRVPNTMNTRLLTIQRIRIRVAFNNLLQVIRVTRTRTQPSSMRLTSNLLNSQLRILVGGRRLTINGQTTRHTIIITKPRLSHNSRRNHFNQPMRIMRITLAHRLLSSMELTSITTNRRIIRRLRLVRQRGTRRH